MVDSAFGRLSAPTPFSRVPQATGRRAIQAQRIIVVGFVFDLIDLASNLLLLNRANGFDCIRV